MTKKKPPEEHKKSGKASSYSTEIADKICTLMVEEGMDLVAICKRDDMPSRMTVYRWMDEHREFDARIARAREGLADWSAARIAEIAENTTKETAEADRLRVHAHQWRAARLAPRRWGDKVEVKADVEVTSAPSEHLATFLAMAMAPKGQSN